MPSTSTRELKEQKTRVSIRLHDPAGPTSMCLVLQRTEGNIVELVLSNHSTVALAEGSAVGVELFALLVSRVDKTAGGTSLGLRYDTKSGRVWLASDGFQSASLLFVRRWELQSALGDLFGS